MFGSWRHPRITALVAALALLPGTAGALETAEIEELETLLRDLGFDPGAVDGVVDADTIAAIRRYQAFAVLPGEPEPSLKLLNELRGVAAAFAALSAAEEETPAEAPAPAPESRLPAPDAPAEPDSGAPETVAEKVIVPPPPPPPKLKPPEAAAPEPAPAAPAPPEAGEKAPEAPPDQLVELPPAAAPLPQAHMPVPAPPEAAPGAPPAPTPDNTAKAEVGPPEPPDPAEQARARIAAELEPFRRELDSGSLSHEELAKRFNEEGRQALERARYDEAVLKFSVAIHLNPKFAGAYSNRGTAYQRQEQTALAAEDFAKAKQLGFGGFRIRDGRKPFN